MNDAGVLIHGYHLQAPDFRHWEEVMWGRPPDLLGRISKGVLLALEQNARLVLVGSGGSELGGKKSGEIARDYLFGHFFKLEKFHAYNAIDMAEAFRLISRILRPLTDPTKTEEEIRFAGEIFHGAGIRKICLVSSPDHISRCIRDALKIFSRDPEFRHFCQNLIAAPSDVCFSAEGVEGVRIVEPPHLPDRRTSNITTEGYD